ncbi:membrane hypothetical protein [Desulfamplus magnetovallimortis]|uniref:Uncharacterized protein n=1 Tax=Desulfamplus magnetovallimortis TaxID=1246637 RepID=A0A1W1HDA7_9BACT|nr:hypothetical protein [Desulfamplus magnetovallimortis]SLM30477.1 membrane hypothetical protein [Desulfamplus magnetovallimortis]
MFFIYFPCALIVAIVVYFDSIKYKMPVWWAPLVFFAPAATPIYLIKTRRKKSVIPIAVCLLISVVVLAGEGFLFSKAKDKAELASHSPAAREIIKFTDRIKDVVNTLNYYTIKLEEVSGVGASTANINETLDFVTDMKALLREHENLINGFTMTVNDYRNLLIAEKLGWLLNIEGYYTETVVVKYLKSFDAYLESFESLLKYTGEYFDEIQMKSLKHRKNYDGYYMNYARALDRHSRIDVGRMKYQYNFLKHYPDLEPYLPKVLDSRFFKIWVKK